MFYSNSTGSNKIKYSNKSIGVFDKLNSDMDEKIISLTESPMTYNFDFSNGALKDGMGVEELNFRYLSYDIDAYKKINNPPDDSFVVACWLFTAWSTEFDIHRPFLIVYTSRGDFYYNRIHSESCDLVKIEGLNFSKKPILTTYNVNGIDTLILVSETDGMYIWQYPTIVRKIENAPPISSMCVHDNKLFVTTYGEKRTVWYSKNLDPTAFQFNSSSSGSFKINDEFGKSNKVISFEGYLYIIRDFNIAKLVSYENSDYNISQLYVSNGRIYENTVCICGNQVLYLASDGVYSFDGNNAKKINLKMDNLFSGIDNSDAVAGYCNGYYYLACRLDYKDGVLVDDQLDSGYVNNALIRINVSTGEMILMRGHDVVGIYVINDIYKSEVCVQIKEYGGQYSVGKLNMSGKYFKKQMTKEWRTPKSDFGMPNKYKIIKEISLDTKQDIEVIIETEKEVKKFKLSGKESSQTLRPMLRCKQIGLRFVSTKEDNLISNPCITVGYV